MTRKSTKCLEQMTSVMVTWCVLSVKLLVMQTLLMYALHALPFHHHPSCFRISQTSTGNQLPTDAVGQFIQQGPAASRSRASPCPSPERSNHEYRHRLTIGQSALLTGSHPFAVENPDVPQPGFEPEVISLKPVAPVE